MHFSEPQKGTAQGWQIVREHLGEIREAANRLAATSDRTARNTKQTEAPPHKKPRHLVSKEGSWNSLMSTIEKLPDEILVMCMQNLDHQSLYRLSQTSGSFLRLSFDLVFEQDPEWRAFRHVVDEAYDGPNGRVVNSTRGSVETTTQTLPQLQQTKGPSEWEVSDSGGDCEEDGDLEEGETMLDFMARGS